MMVGMLEAAAHARDSERAALLCHYRWEELTSATVCLPIIKCYLTYNGRGRKSKIIVIRKNKRNNNRN